MSRAADQSNKDKARASWMKAHNVRRTQQRCPLNHKHMTQVGNGFVNHLSTCSHSR